MVSSVYYANKPVRSSKRPLYSVDGGDRSITPLRCKSECLRESFSADK